MNEEFNVGDRVVYEDAYTGEIKYGVITNMFGNDAIIRTTTKQEAGPSPKPLPKLRIACRFERRPGDDVQICGYHRKPLIQLALHGDPNPAGLGHLSAWTCPESNKTVYEVEGF
jgi:hypothetical protein